jgi:hypothetical protein
MGYFLSKLAKEVGRLTGWRQKVFGRRYQHIVVSDEELEQVRRFRYVLSHGVTRYQYATREILTLEPLPCWKHLSEEQRRQRVAGLVEEIESTAATQREAQGIRPLGPAAILAQDPRSEPRAGGGWNQ